MASELSSENKGDQCVWYFLNVFVDTIIGTFICYGLLRCVNYIAGLCKYENLKSGLYYDIINVNGRKVARMKVKRYIIQVIAWICIVIAVSYINLDEIYNARVYGSDGAYYGICW